MTDFGVHDFAHRFSATDANESMMLPFLKNLGLTVCQFGQHALLPGAEGIIALLRDRASKVSSAALLVKFSPDLVAYSPKKDFVFFIDVKTSLTPVILDGYIRKLGAGRGRTLRREQIGVVEREAWDNYRERYPSDRTAVLMACPYNPKLLMMDWATRIVPIFRFTQNVNYRSAGSGTPHVNIDLDCMRTLREFLEQELDVMVGEKEHLKLLETIKTWPIQCADEKYRYAFPVCVAALKKTCPWVKSN